ncbi:Pex12 amino terminal region-domain-containing protein [Nemania sp. FL0916]|nr:Pex12 amino terminal region-domain-containing protein [Nemania sp. FL0916]
MAESKSPPSPPPPLPTSPPTSSSSPGSSFANPPYPYAFAPDIIRAHQKDAYFQGLLTNHLTDLHRRLLGARSAHGWSTEARTAADLLYLCLTTLIGNRTLGEEYCGLVQIEAPSSSSSHAHQTQQRRLPSIQRRAAYIAGSILLPYGLAKLLPLLRARVRTWLQRNLARAEAQAQTQIQRDAAKPSSLKGGGNGNGNSRKTATATQTWTYKTQTYLLANLSTLTSPAPVHALGLALFYFSGSYYELAKRLTGLRYIFTSRAQAGSPSSSSTSTSTSTDRAGYEVLGVLLVVQLGVQMYLHVQSTLSSFAALSPSSSTQSVTRERSAGGDVHVSLDEHAYSANNAILLTEMGTPGPGTSINTLSSSSRVDISTITNTPPPAPSSQQPSSKHAGSGDISSGRGEGSARYDLADERAMAWIQGAQQRKCTLCLEELKDPAATQCGHVFCWACIGDWVREKPECPLCRREAMVQHILPLRAF